MTGALGTVALLVLIGLGVWLFGSFALRIGGLLLFLLGLFGLTQGTPEALIIVVLGGIAWLAGHWLFAYKHHFFKSGIARRIFQQTPLSRIDPTRGWGVPMVSHEAGVQTVPQAPPQPPAQRSDDAPSPRRPGP
jgi:hypothetical protein